jgi:REP element-mobilizing transposase RayT
MNLVSGSYKVNPKTKPKNDTRNSWHEFVLVSKCRYNVFRKQKTIDACMEGFIELCKFGFEFGQIGFAGTHAHLSVNMPKRYSVQNTEIMLKSLSSQRIFAQIPNFRKRYPRGSFWSRYEHHQSIGKDREESARYIKSQPEHHNINNPFVQKAVFDFTTVLLTNFAP